MDLVALPPAGLPFLTLPPQYFTEYQMTNPEQTGALFTWRSGAVRIWRQGTPGSLVEISPVPCCAIALQIMFPLLNTWASIFRTETSGEFGFTENAQRNGDNTVDL
jgi:hypothetical protein